MKLQVRFLVLMCLFPLKVLAVPDQIEFIFLSTKIAWQLNRMIEKQSRPYLYIYRSLAQAGKEECIPMGEGCFHPQHGIISDSNGTEVQELEIPQGIPDVPVDDSKGETTLKTINSEQTNLIKCEEGNYFDIFCGKAKAASGAAPIEVWVDTSSSMRQVDYSKEAGRCFRRSFVSKIQDRCTQKKISFAIFDTAIKDMGALESLCQTYGMNNTRKLIDWVEGSKAKHLFVITDIDEYNFELRDFLDRINAKVHGVGAKGMVAEDLMNFGQQIAKLCQ